MTANAHQADLAAADDLAANTVDVVTPISAPTQTSTPSATPAVVNPQPSKSSQPTTKKTKPKKTATPATPSKPWAKTFKITLMNISYVKKVRSSQKL